MVSFYCIFLEIIMSYLSDGVILLHFFINDNELFVEWCHFTTAFFKDDNELFVISIEK